MRDNEKTLGEIMDEGHKFFQEAYQIKVEADRLQNYIATHPNITVEEGKRIGNKLVELNRKMEILNQKQERFIQSTRPQQNNSSFADNNTASDGDLKNVFIGCLAVVAVVGGVGYAVVMYIKDFLTDFFR